MITAFPSPQLEHLARQLGADIVLSKPIGLLGLNAVVSTVLGRPGAAPDLPV
jgi:DNA-binding response OmpR family regulator